MNLDREIPVIRVFRRRNFRLADYAPLVEDANPPEQPPPHSPNHHFGNHLAPNNMNLERNPRNSIFYYSDSDEDMDEGEVVDEIREDSDVDPFKYVDPRTRIGKDTPYNMQFPCKIGYKSFDAYLNSSLPMNIISRANYNKIMVNELEYNGENVVARVEPLHVFVGSFVYLVDFMVMEDLGEFIDSALTQVILGRPFKELTRLDEKLVEGIITFSEGDEDYTFQMARTHRRFAEFSIEKRNRYPPLNMLSENDKKKGLKYPHEKNKNNYRGCLDLSDEYKKDENTIRWLTLGYVSISDTR